jgi:hypothetical protein
MGIETRPVVGFMIGLPLTGGGTAARMPLLSRMLVVIVARGVRLAATGKEDVALVHPS